MYLDYAKTVKIPVRVYNGGVKYFYGGNLPQIKNGVVGELILPESSVNDKDFIDISQMEQEVQIFPTGQSLMFSVSKKSIPGDKMIYIKEIRTAINSSDGFVEIVLQEPLKLLMRGSKSSILINSKCFIPSLKKEANSLNIAYTIISEVFETHRSSYTGNVFSKCFYQYDELWYSLDNKRENEEGRIEERFFLDYKKFTLNKNKNRDGLKLKNCEELLLRYLFEFQFITGEKVKQLYNNDKQKYIAVINNLLDKEVIMEVNK